MNDVERMAGQITALSRRIERLEKLARCQAANSQDSTEAGRVAEIIGFPVEILVIPERLEERRTLALELRRRKWSFSRIARALNCAERTVWRWTESN